MGFSRIFYRFPGDFLLDFLFVLTKLAEHGFSPSVGE